MAKKTKLELDLDDLMDQPIEEFIGRQCRTLWPDMVNLFVKYSTRGWKYKHIKPAPSVPESVEDALLEAIDKKYSFRFRRTDLVWALYCRGGYNQKEIADLLGVTIRTVQRDFKKIRDRSKHVRD